MPEILHDFVQGWTRKLNCFLHVCVVLLMICHLRKSALLTQKMGFYWFLLKDDANVCGTLCKMLLTRAALHSLCNKVMRLFKTLGFKMAEDKTLTSVTLFQT